MLDAAYENKNEFQPRTLSIEVQDKAGVLNEVRKIPIVLNRIHFVTCMVVESYINPTASQDMSFPICLKDPGLTSVVCMCT